MNFDLIGFVLKLQQVSNGKSKMFYSSDIETEITKNIIRVILDFGMKDVYIRTLLQINVICNEYKMDVKFLRLFSDDSNIRLKMIINKKLEEPKGRGAGPIMHKEHGARSS